MRRYRRFVFFLVLAAAVALAGSAVMYGAVFTAPLAENTKGVTPYLVTLFIIAVGLAAPYWVLKLSVHAAHERDPREKEVALKDIPKDKDELDGGKTKAGSA
jgi:hypothetical protein